MRIEKSLTLGITRLCRMIPNSDPEEQIFLSTPNDHDRFFFLHTIWSPAYIFNVGVAINGSCSYTLTSAILKVDFVCDDTMTSTPRVCLNNSYVSYLSYGLDKGMQDMFCQHSENRRKPCLICKKGTVLLCWWESLKNTYHTYIQSLVFSSIYW